MLFSAWLTFQPWRRRRNPTPIRRLSCNELYDVMSHRCERLKSCLFFKQRKSFCIFQEKRKMTRNIRYTGQWRQKICGRRSVNVFKMQNEFSTRDNSVLWGSMPWQFRCMSLDSVGNFNARRGPCNWNVFWIYSSLQNIGSTQQPIYIIVI